MTFNPLHKPICREHGVLFCSCLALICFFSFAGYGEGADLFSAQSLRIEGKVLSVIPTNLDDRGSVEIVVVHKTGVYPKEKRWISVFSANALAKYLTTARQQWEVDPAASIFDVGDISSSPGKEIFYLTGQGISYYPRKENGIFSTAPHHLLSFPTITVFPAVGSLPRMRLFADWKRNGRKILLLPQFDSLMFFERSRSEKWQKAERVNIQPRTFLYSDQADDGSFRDFSLHTEFRLPRIFVEDFNGDGHPDLLLTEQESVTIYLQQSDGHFSHKPSVKFVFPVRPSGKDSETSLFFLSTPVDVNGDKFVDVILTLTKSTGKFLEREILIFIFLNQQDPDAPFLPKPDQTITVDGITPGINIEDVNGDGRGDLLLSYIRVGFWNIFKNLISKRVDLNTSIYLMKKDSQYPIQPDFHSKTSYQIDLTHGISFHGTWPTLGGDFSGDGHRDLLIARDEKITIYPKNLNGDLFSPPLIQSGVFTSPFMHIVDLNSDGRDDLLFYEKKREGKICVLLNTGEWKDLLVPKNKTSFPSEK
ncbi:MAG: VCBS repeat-containing protein [Deltaproteobacteria bacterium]|nr:VCBS repeat-containing protein [Deltaproteobacteria bacterium]